MPTCAHFKVWDHKCQLKLNKGHTYILWFDYFLITTNLVILIQEWLEKKSNSKK